MENYKRLNAKKTIAFLLLLVFSVLCLCLFASCESQSEVKKLPAPVLTLGSYMGKWHIISWEYNELYGEDVSFVIDADGMRYFTDEYSFDISNVLKRDKRIDIKVKAKGDEYYADSDWSYPLAVFPSSFSAEDGVYYSEDKTLSLKMRYVENLYGYEIDECLTAAGDVVLPQEFNGAPVVGIKTGAFSGMDEAASITVPQGYRQLSRGSFRDCKNLKKLSLPETISDMVAGPIYRCDIEKMSIDSANPWYMSEGNCIIRKKDSALMYASACSNIPEQIKSIEMWAFYSESFTSVTIPSGVTEIGRDSFGYCPNLKQVEMSAGMCAINGSAFNLCPNIAEFVVAEDNPVFKSEAGNVIRRRDNLLVAGVISGVIPDYVTEIGEYAFAGRNLPTTLTIPKNITKIGQYAFFGCNTLEYAYVPNSVTAVGIGAFWEMIGDDTNQHIGGLYSVTLPDSVLVIETQAAITYHGANSEIGYDNGYPYVVSYTQQYNDTTKEAFIQRQIEGSFGYRSPYRLGYTFGGYSATLGGELITTSEQFESAVVGRLGVSKRVKLYPIWIPNE